MPATSEEARPVETRDRVSRSSAAIGPLSLQLGDVIPADELGAVFRTWTLGDACGVLVVTPLMLTWATAGLEGLHRRELAEGTFVLGVLVALESYGDATALGPLGRQIAMHVAATNPVALDAAGVDKATVERESNILREKNAGKPDYVLAKIIESGLKSYYKEVTLLEQPFVHDGSKTVSQVLKEAGSKVGGPVALTGFVRYALGEGIEKEEGPDFATEVAQQAGRA